MESRYLDSLIAPFSEETRDVYDSRSPLKHVDGINCALALFQGDEDEVIAPFDLLIILLLHLPHSFGKWSQLCERKDDERFSTENLDHFAFSFARLPPTERGALPGPRNNFTPKKGCGEAILFADVTQLVLLD